MNKNESKYFNTALKMDEALLALLEKKDFEFITVKEVCAKASVNRSTFYLHYENTYDLLAEILNGLMDRFIASFPRTHFKENIDRLELNELFLVTDDYLVPYLQFVSQNQRVFKAICSHPTLFDAEKSYQWLFNTIVAPILSRFGVPEVEREYMMEFYVKGVSAIVVHWVNRDCKEPMEQITKLIKSCIPSKYVKDSESAKSIE